MRAMKELLSSWYKKYFSQPEAVVLGIFLFSLLFILNFFGDILAPLIASVIIAYFLEWCVDIFSFTRLPRKLIFIIIYCIFLGLLMWIIFALLPLLWKQLASFIESLPSMLEKGSILLSNFMQKYSKFTSEDFINSISVNMRTQLTTYGQHLLSISIQTIPSIISIIVYVLLVPLLVFFMLFDKENLAKSFSVLIPKDNVLIKKVWAQLDEGIGNYIRGRIIEIIIVSVVAYMAFYYLNLQYASLLAVGMGLSTLLPYIGAIIITFPVALVAFFQWGATVNFAYTIIVYAIIMFLDGNILVPILFSETVNIHPVSILVAILVFGGIWGFWGVFFAIPLAILIKAVVSLWPVAR